MSGDVTSIAAYREREKRLAATAIGAALIAYETARAAAETTELAIEAQDDPAPAMLRRLDERRVAMAQARGALVELILAEAEKRPS